MRVPGTARVSCTTPPRSPTTASGWRANGTAAAPAHGMAARSARMRRGTTTGRGATRKRRHDCSASRVSLYLMHVPFDVFQIRELVLHASGIYDCAFQAVHWRVAFGSAPRPGRLGRGRRAVPEPSRQDSSTKRRIHVAESCRLRGQGSLLRPKK